MPYNRDVYRAWREKNRPYKIYTCAVCGDDFKPKCGTQKTCSVECRYLRCVFCGNKFLSKNGRLDQKYCSTECHDSSQKGIEPKHLRENRGRKPRTYKKRNKHGCVEDREWRVVIFKRDNYTCVECGQIGGKLQAHHIKPYAKYPDLRWDLDNGLTLCIECHKKTDTYGWQNYWKSQISAKRHEQAKTGLTPAEQDAGQQTLFGE